MTRQLSHKFTGENWLGVAYKASPDESSVSKGIGNRSVAIHMHRAMEMTIEAMVTYQPASGPQFEYRLIVPSPNCA